MAQYRGGEKTTSRSHFASQSKPQYYPRPESKLGQGFAPHQPQHPVFVTINFSHHQNTHSTDPGHHHHNLPYTEHSRDRGHSPVPSLSGMTGPRVRTISTTDEETVGEKGKENEEPSLADMGGRDEWQNIDGGARDMEDNGLQSDHYESSAEEEEDETAASVWTANNQNLQPDRSVVDEQAEKGGGYDDMPDTPRDRSQRSRRQNSLFQPASGATSHNSPRPRHRALEDKLSIATGAKSRRRERSISANPLSPQNTAATVAIVDLLTKALAKRAVKKYLRSSRPGEKREGNWRLKVALELVGWLDENFLDGKFGIRKLKRQGEQELVSAPPGRLLPGEEEEVGWEDEELPSFFENPRQNGRQRNRPPRRSNHEGRRRRHSDSNKKPKHKSGIMATAFSTLARLGHKYDVSEKSGARGDSSYPREHLRQTRHHTPSRNQHQVQDERQPVLSFPQGDVTQSVLHELGELSLRLQNTSSRMKGLLATTSSAPSSNAFGPSMPNGGRREQIHNNESVRRLRSEVEDDINAIDQTVEYLDGMLYKDVKLPAPLPRHDQNQEMGQGQQHEQQLEGQQHTSGNNRSDGRDETREERKDRHRRREHKEGRRSRRKRYDGEDEIQVQVDEEPEPIYEDQDRERRREQRRKERQERHERRRRERDAYYDDNPGAATASGGHYGGHRESRGRRRERDGEESTRHGHKSGRYREVGRESRNTG